MSRESQSNPPSPEPNGQSSWVDDLLATESDGDPQAGRRVLNILRAHAPQPGSWRQPGVARQRLYDPGREVELPGSEVHFPPITNGLDYLVSAVEHLEAGDERVSARDLKYAALHLAAGAEVLLKARLQPEHWPLVFTDPAKAKQSALDDGTLDSCSPGDTVLRLRDIAGVAIRDQEAKALSTLAKDVTRCSTTG